MTAAQGRPEAGVSRRVLRRLARGSTGQLRRPAVVVALGFAGMILLVTVLLMLPAAHEHGRPTALRDALFTATSAVCVTGLIVVDTPTHWSTFGEVVIVSGIQVGGFGFMTSASLFRGDVFAVSGAADAIEKFAVETGG